MHPTLDVYETRRENLNRLLKEPGSKTQLATRLGTSQSHITHLLKPPTAPSSRAIREETARAIEDIIGLEHGTLDRPTPPDVVMTNSKTGTTVFLEAKNTRRGEAYPPTVVDFHNQVMRAQGDAELLEEAFRQVLEALAANHTQLAPEKAAKMARLVYEQGLATGKIDSSLVSSLIALMV